MDDYTKFHINKKMCLLNKVVLEVQYDYGYTYLDHCGKTTNTILREYPEWIVRGEIPNPGNAGLVSLRNNCVLNFSPLNYLFLLDQEEGKPISKDSCEEFIEQVKSISRLLHDNLSLKRFTRIGCRIFYFFNCSTKPEVEAWLKELGCYSYSPAFIKAFGNTVETTAMTIFIAGEDRMYRVAFNRIERNLPLELDQQILHISPKSLSSDQRNMRKKRIQALELQRQNPDHAAMIDIDAFIENPISIDPSQFAETSIKGFRDKLLQGIDKKDR